MNSSDQVSLAVFQKVMVRAGRPFVSYRLPGEPLTVTIFGPGSFQKLDSFRSLLDQANGFVMAPFEENGPIWWLESENRVVGNFVDIRYLPKDTAPQMEFSFLTVTPPSRDQYIRMVSDAIHHIERGEAGKIVLSRPIVHELKDSVMHSGGLFAILCEMYPSAFVYLAHMPGMGLWTGASPELLLRKDGPEIHTISLSGTRAASSGDVPWGDKETNEHLWVSRFIAEQLEFLGCENMKVSPMNTVPAGRVEHLRTTFSATCSESRTASLIYALHPTPAVCGWPTMSAYNLIRRIENYDRSFYTGFMGPLFNRNDFSFFVNLRCMNLLKDQAVIYVGGGITIDSNPQDEWNETEMKSRTMLGAIEKLANFAD